MNNKFLRALSILMLSLVLLVFLTACGAGKLEDEALSDVVYNGYEEFSDSAGSTSGAAKENSASVKDSRKIIETIDYTVETKEFDKLIASLEERAASAGGYIEQSDVSGNAYEYNDTRTASYVFRIPKDKVQEFTGFVADNSTVTNKSITTEDVTLSYVDTESRIKALKTEKESLEQLLESAKSTSEIIEIRDMLTEVIYEIETNESQLRTYDNLIDYTSITVDIYEVEYTSVVEKQTTWQRIGTNLVDNFRGVWNFLVELFVFVLSSLPYLLLLAVVAVIVIVIIKSRKRKNSKKVAVETISESDDTKE